MASTIHGKEANALLNSVAEKLMPNTFQIETLRHEDKYLIPQNYCDLLIKKLHSFARIDEQAANHGGQYNVTSLYYDNYKHKCYESNDAGYDPRRKWRIRIYNSNNALMKLERKDKYCGLTAKASCGISFKQYNLIQNNRLKIDEKQQSIINQFIIEKQLSLLQPTVVVDYERIPFVYEADNVRLTIDYNIKSKPCYALFSPQSISGIPILLKGMVLFEVKYNNRLPTHIQHIINLKGIERVSFSKYCLCLSARRGGII